jgi:mandelate racemase
VKSASSTAGRWFDAFELRLGRDKLEDDLLAISQVRAAVGSNAKLMVDFSPGLTLGGRSQTVHLDD